MIHITVQKWDEDAYIIGEGETVEQEFVEDEYDAYSWIIAYYPQSEVVRKTENNITLNKLDYFIDVYCIDKEKIKTIYDKIL